MIPPPTVALVILNYNGKKYLERFLPSVLKYAPQHAQIIVGDNASTDDSIDFVATQYPGVRLIRLEHNLGFAGGYNQVLLQVESDLYFLINSDIELRGPTDPLVSLMHQDHQIAALQPKILSFNKPDHFEHAGGAGGWIDMFGYPFCKGRLLDFFEKDEGQYDQSGEIFWASGAAMMVRASLFHEIGGFDSKYFAHMEEIDWCWRAKRAGWKIVAEPGVSVYHIGGGTLPYNSNQKIYLNFRNNIATLIKNETTLKLIFILPSRIILDLMAAVSFASKANFSGCISIFKAYRTLLSWMPYLIKKRSQTNRMVRGKKFNRHGIYHGSLIWQFFVLGKKKFNQLIPAHV